MAVVNGLRGVAILAVLHHHLVAPWVTPFGMGEFYRPFGLPVFPKTVFYNGWLGVNLFFVLSGFVLALPYEQGRRELSSAGDAASFFVRRARRLLPLYYLVLLVLLVTSADVPLSDPRFFREFLSLATFAFAFDGRRFLPVVNPALWSIGVEAWFSALFPLLLVFRRRFGARALVASALVLSLAVRLVATSHFRGPPVYQFMGKDNVFGRLDEFAAGMGIAALFARRRAPRGVAAAALFGVGAVLFATSGLGWDWTVLRVLPYENAALLHDVTLAGSVAVLLGALGAPGPLRSALTFRPLSVIGMMCYSLYSWHFVGASRLLSGALGEAEMPAYLALVLLVSATSYRFVEFPEKSFRELFLAPPH